MFYLIIIFCIHFLADFCMQTEWMALGKSKEMAPLLAHIGTYTLILLLFSSLFMTGPMAIIWSISNGICHMWVDYFSSRAMRRARESGQERKFFMILGLDQMLHYVCLFGILGLLL
jgi:hypothetical protein